MRTTIAAVALATLVASPAFAQSYDPDLGSGNIAAQVGDNPNEKQRANFGLPPDKWKDGICNSPHGASIDKDGNLIVTEWTQFGHLHKFVRAPRGVE